MKNYLSKIEKFKFKNYISNFRNNYPFGIIVISITVVFLFLLYFTIPTFYNYENFEKEFQKKISKDFKLDIKNISGITYLMLPSPHFLIEECDIYFPENPENQILKAKNLKINIYSKNFHKKEKIELKNIYLNKIDLNLEFEDIKNFYNHLKYNISKPIFLNNVNLFFRDQNNEIILISKVKKFEYFFNLKNKEKKLNILGNLFGSNFKFNWEKNFINPYITNSNIKFNNPNLNISNIFNKQNENFVKAQTNFSFLRNKLNLRYKFNKDKIEFTDDKNKKNYHSKLIGNIKLDPFFFDLNLILSNISIETALKNIFLNLYKTNKSSYLNFNGNLKINLNEINNRLFENLVLNINFLEDKITLDQSSLSLKKIGKINFSTPVVYEKNQQIFVKSKITFDVDNQQELYKRFLISRQNRIDLKKVYFEIEYNIDEANYYLSNINFTENSEEIKEFFEVNNFQQLNSLISNEFKKVILD